MIYVVVRQTLNWEAATVGDLMDEFAQSTAHVWNRMFRISYFEARARIKAISMDCLRSLDPDVQVHEARTFPAFAIQPDDVFLFCDDDDWYHPEVIEEVKAAAPFAGGFLLWPDGVYGYHAGTFHVDDPRLRPLEEPCVSGPVKTNNYAVSGEMAKRLRAVWAHPRIVRLFKEQRPVATRLSRPLSLVNRHPCSYTVWKHALRDVEPAQVGVVLRRLVTHYGFARIDQPMDPAFSWAAPYIERVQQVFDEVRELD